VRIYGNQRMVMALDPDVDDPALLHAVVLLLRGQACVAVVRSGGAHVRTADRYRLVHPLWLHPFPSPVDSETSTGGPRRTARQRHTTRPKPPVSCIVTFDGTAGRSCERPPATTGSRQPHRPFPWSRKEGWVP
jgi:hypothetical protein